MVKSAVDGPQEISVRGRPAAIVLSIGDYRRLKGRRLSAAQFVQRSRRVAVELPLRRDRTPARRVDLGAT